MDTSRPPDAWSSGDSRGEGGGERLSGGERRPLALARALLRPAPWLMLDKPTEGLDNSAQAAVIAALDAHLVRTGQGLPLVPRRSAPWTLCAPRLDISGAP
jgi:ATP-binding cassette subfamily C protein CydC